MLTYELYYSTKMFSSLILMIDLIMLIYIKVKLKESPDLDKQLRILMTCWFIISKERIHAHIKTFSTSKTCNTYLCFGIIFGNHLFLGPRVSQTCLKWFWPIVRQAFWTPFKVLLWAFFHSFLVNNCTWSFPEQSFLFVCREVAAK